MTSELELHAPTQARQIRVIVADDSELMRESLKLVLNSLPRVEVLRTACDGEEAVALSLSMEPDLVVLDYKMPRLDGLTAARVIKMRLPQTKVVMVSMHDLRRHHPERSGVDGFVSKMDVGAKLQPLIERLFA